MGWTDVLKPRLSVKYIFWALVTSYFSICILFRMPFFSSKLPAYTGPYKVGTIDIEAPVEKRNISEARFANGGKPAFELETVLFSLYYPANKDARSHRPHHHWISRPVGLHAEGYARFAHINNFFTNNLFTFSLWTLAGSTTIPAEVDVPLNGTIKGYRNYDKEHPLDDYGLPRHPVIVFSHGMASSRTSYTQYCAELASRGFVVAAIEHRDGSGPGSVIMSEGKVKHRFHINADQLDPSPETADFKVMQLAYRQAEIEETVRVLRQLNEGIGGDFYRSNPREEGKDLAEWRGRLIVDSMVISGHSYGATGALQALAGGPTYERPFVGAVILDPGKQSGPLNDDIHVPMIIIHSQSWSNSYSIFQGRPHFDVVKDIAVKNLDEHHKFTWFMTSIGTTHPSVTDAPLIEPLLLSWTTGATIEVREGVKQYVLATEDFMHFLSTEQRKGVLKEETTHPRYDEDIRDEDRKQHMDQEVAKYWQIHVAPTTACAAPGLCGVWPDRAGRPGS
ncbi:hypothetical protein LTR78_010523 [Recurvomyces mirabilis]|uniref:Putative phospholipase n=1 Tax=Recurvomyces mirabilis TaxID=574656 RepID=A0AAE0TLR1_9PEZI|nr:hypothetical protein LTR78_010523 [Recurvomyces mirabilis]KAK5149609.1 hypothetical protein LTS14_010811 [Recurvomyces mirabilis]